MPDAEILGRLARQRALSLSRGGILAGDNQLHRTVGGEARGDGKASFDLSG